MGAVSSAILGVYCFTLSKTPPVVSRDAKVSVKEVLGLDALNMLKDRNFLIFVMASIFICIPLYFYYQYSNPFLIVVGVENSNVLMTRDQFLTDLFMLLFPFFLVY